MQRRPVSHKPEARRALDHYNKENKAECNNMALGAVQKDGLKVGYDKYFWLRFNLANAINDY